MKYVVGGVFSQKVIFEDEETVVQTVKQEPYQAWSGRPEPMGECTRSVAGTEAMPVIWSAG